MTFPASSRSDDREAEGRELRFLPIGAEHAEVLEMLFAANDVPAVAGSFDPFPLTRERARSIATTPRRDSYYLLLDGAEPVAFSMLRGADEGYSVPSFGIFVDHRHHGRGLGRKLTKATVLEARRCGAPAVRLTVYADNAPARRLYESLGFAETERRSEGGREKVTMRLALADDA